MNDLHWFTFVPVWVIQDIVVILLAVLTIGFILLKEKRPGPILLEFFCFVFLYAAVYENLATVMGWYGFGHSVVMVFNVPITVPVVEYLIVYSAIRLGSAMRIPTWTIPVLVGGSGVLADLVLDPLALSQVAQTAEGTIGRWSWYIEPDAVNYFGAPVYNYTGWMLLCGYAAAFILLGRWWFRRSGEKVWVGILYPVLTLLAALAVMVSPLSAFLLWFGGSWGLPSYVQQGGWPEYVLFGLAIAGLLAVILAWHGRMRRALTWRDDWIIPVVFGVFHLSNIVFLIIGAQWAILWPSLGIIAVQWGLVVWAFLAHMGRQAGVKVSTAASP